MHRVCACMHINVCLWCLEHITIGKLNLTVIALIKAVFLQLRPNGRQHQLHKTTGTRRGCPPQPHWHPLWTSPDFKWYLRSDYCVTDCAQKGRRQRNYILQITYIRINFPCWCLWNTHRCLKTYTYRTIMTQRSIIKVTVTDKKPQKMANTQMDTLYMCKLGCYYMFSLMAEPWISNLAQRGSWQPQYLSGWAPCWGSPSISPSNTFPPLLPISALRSTAAARSPQEATGWGFSKPIFSF